MIVKAAYCVTPRRCAPPPQAALTQRRTVALVPASPLRYDAP